MNILKILRKPYLATFLASIILFVSCEQNSLSNTENTFDYSVHNELVNTTSIEDINNMINPSPTSSSKADTIDRGVNILANINQYYNSKLSLPNEFLAMSDFNPQEIVTVALDNGWMNQDDVDLVNKFESDFQSADFETALKNYEDSVLNLELNDLEFAKKNLVANAFKSMNNYYPEVFSTDTNSSVQSRGGGWACFRAATALTLSSVGLASCATVILCGLAVTAWIISYATYVDSCQKKETVNSTLSE